MRIFSKSILVPTVVAGTLFLVGGLFVARFATNSTEKAGAAPEKPVPVQAVQAVERDIPIYRAGIGFVEAFNKVSMTSRVEGQLITVSFKEGQEVKAGDILALIDPRPFEAALRSK